MEITSIRTTGLGDTTYMLAHEGQGIVVDPQRDVGRFEAAVDTADITVRYVFETHLHNDYVSGGRALAAATGAELVLPAAAAAAFAHLPAFHQEDLDAGPFTVRPIHTPGHTPEHMSYLVLVDGEPVAVFSGGSLLVGSAGRPDLLGPERAETLARLQYRSVTRLGELPEDVGLFPTHGAGSFCTAGTAGRSTSTIGIERRSNPFLQYPDAAAFVAGQLTGLQPFPSYYAHMGPINLAGPEPADDGVPPEISLDEVPAGSEVIDIRAGEHQAAGRVPGALGIPFSDQVGVWSGWLVPFDAIIVLVADRDQDVHEVTRQFTRIGFDHVRGVVYDLPAASDPGGPSQTYRLVTTGDLVDALEGGDGPQVLDVRAPDEWDAGHIDGSLHCYLPDLASGIPDALDPDRDVWIICRTGFRAQIAASYLLRAGFSPVVVNGRGVPDVLRAGSKLPTPS